MSKNKYKNEITKKTNKSNKLNKNVNNNDDNDYSNKTSKLEKRNKLEDYDDLNNELNNDLDNDLDNESDNETDDDLINPVEFFTEKELCRFKKITDFFKECSINNIQKMIDIIEGNSKISLRVLDWFVTKYSKKMECDGIGMDVFDVKMSYKAQLRIYKKRCFDPFRRRKKFKYYFNDEQCIYTTLGQLNFFKWAFQNGIIIYVEKNFQKIHKEMNISNKEEKQRKLKIKENGKDSSSTSSSSSLSSSSSNKTKSVTKAKRYDEIINSRAPIKLVFE